jgi:hypothetical protein
MVFTTSPEKGSPTPQLWLRIKLRCSSATLAGEMEVSASLPKPVLIPYTGEPSSKRRSTNSLAFAAFSSCLVSSENVLPCLIALTTS